MTELFDEVDEEVRREQLKKLWDRYSLYIVALALLVIASVGGWRGYQYLEAKKAAAAGDAFNKAVELSEQNKHAEAEAAFTELAAKAPSGYRMLARFRAAAETPTAIRRPLPSCSTSLPPIAAFPPSSRIWRRIRAAGLLLDTASYQNMVERLEPSTGPGATFRHEARELLALSAWRANDVAATRQWLDMIALDGETPPSVRSRAEALQALLPPVAKS